LTTDKDCLNQNKLISYFKFFSCRGSVVKVCSLDYSNFALFILVIPIWKDLPIFPPVSLLRLLVYRMKAKCGLTSLLFFVPLASKVHSNVCSWFLESRFLSLTTE